MNIGEFEKAGALQPDANPLESGEDVCRDVEKTGDVSAVYAPIWKRVVAFLIDMAILCIAGLVIFSFLGIPTAGPAAAFWGHFPLPFILTVCSDIGLLKTNEGIRIFLIVLGILLLSSLMVILYMAMTEYWFQGTFGKLLMGIRVVEASGNPISFKRAFRRNCAKIFYSGVLLFGYFFVFGGNTRQTLHDRLASTYVVKHGMRIECSNGGNENAE